MVDPFYAPPASPTTGRRDNLWWTVAAIGIGVFLLAQVIIFFNEFDDIRDSRKAGLIFALLGYLALVVGMTLASMMQAGLHWGARVALLLGAAFFATQVSIAGIFF